MDGKRYTHKAKLSDIKKAAQWIVDKNNRIAAQIKLEKDMHNGNTLFHFKLTITVYGKNRTANTKYEYYADTKEKILCLMLNLKDISEYDRELFFAPFCF